MNFFIPTQLYAEPDSVQKHSRELVSLGTKAFLVTGVSSSKKNGSLKAVIHALDTHSIPYTLYDKIEENPSVESVMEAAKQGIQEKVDFVIGIGGGSPLDAAKAIALLIANPNDSADILYQKVSRDALPVAAIPTTAGTGSEVTPYSILTLHKEKTKRSISHRIFPRLALIDSSYLKNMPGTILANTAVDALGHLIESYINSNATSYSKMFCEYGFELWGSVKNVFAEPALTDEAAETLMTASTIAGMAISHTGTSLPHGMSYSLTYDRGTPHGKAVGIFLPAYLDQVPDPEVKKKVLRLIGFDTIAAFRSHLETLLGTVTMDKTNVEQCISAMMQNQAKLSNCPYPVDASILHRIYQDSVVIS